MSRRTVLVARLDADGDVLLAGPAVRAVAASGARVVLLVGPRGRQAAGLLPGVDAVHVWSAPWIDPGSDAPDAAHVDALLRVVRGERVDEAVVLTSFHQSALPLALLLRLAHVRAITAISEDFPGSLLDARVADPGDVPETERALHVAVAAGFRLPAGDDGRPRVTRPLPDTLHLTGPGPYVVLHPGTSVPARAWPQHRWESLARSLGREGARVVVTGTAAEHPLGSAVSAAGGDAAVDLSGLTTFAELAGVLDRAGAVVVANTGPAHLAAAVGTPVVSLFAPTVPAARWAPQGPDVVVLGDQWAPCRGTRATTCPVEGHPCLSSVTEADVRAALGRMRAVPAA